MGYAELHCHTNFSFLDGASHPEELVAEAARLGLAGLAVTDHDGFYGVVRFALAAADHGVPTVFGSELTLGITRPANGEPDPEGEHVLVLAEGPVGYARLARAISVAQMAGEKGAPRSTIAALADLARAPVHLHPEPSVRNDRWYVLTGCRKGTVPAALLRDGPAAARRALDELVDAFGRDRGAGGALGPRRPARPSPQRRARDHRGRRRSRRGRDQQRALRDARPAPARHRARRQSRGPLARRDRRVAAGVALRAPAQRRRAAPTVRPLAGGGGAHRRHRRACAFDLQLASPELPDHDVPPGHTEMTWLRELTMRGAAVRYPGTHPFHDQAMHQIAHELDVIEQLNFPGYFLVLVDIVEFCRVHDIYCQGRGSAANSAVCYALDVTKADAVTLGLLFERFLSLERDGPPDIDLDIEHQRREEVIQYVYGKHGRERAAQVANVITYRPRSSRCGRWRRPPACHPGRPTRSRSGSTGGATPRARSTPCCRTTGAPAIPPLTLRLAEQVLDFPRHLGIHSGGMVMADRPLVEYCPVEWARAWRTARCSSGTRTTARRRAS